MAFDLNTLLAPCCSEDFFKEYWESKPLHLSRRAPHYYDSVLANEALETIISSADLRYPAIQLARSGSYLPPEAYTKNIKHGGEFFNGVPDLARIQAEYRSGATVVLPALQRIWPPLKELCVALENEFSHAIHANAYLTPGDSSGFTPHYDAHEVFVLQIEGRKRWRVFEAPLKLPHWSQPFTPSGYVLPKPLLEIELQPGDLLYLPRGFVHAAATSDGHSAHVTVGITVFTWVEVLSELMASAKSITDLRAGLPPGFATHEDSKKVLREGLVKCMDQLKGNVDYDRLIETFLQRLRSGRTRSVEAFRASVRVIGLQTPLTTPEAGRYSISMENGSTVLEFDGRKFLLPHHISTTLDEMCKRKLFRPGELRGPLDNDGKLQLARYLHGERFLTLAD
ncbi:MAG TPA: cupin domain-containing protein [Methylocella sp.]|nr:cupin domain-containing protein [Methylocella sp.]